MQPPQQEAVGLEPGSAAEQVHPPRLPRQSQGLMRGGLPAAGHGHGPAAPPPRAAEGGVAQAAAEEAGLSAQSQVLEDGPRTIDHGPGPEPGPRLEPQGIPARRARHRKHPRPQGPQAPAPRLADPERHQGAAGHAPREPRVVLDALQPARLPSQAVSLHQDDPEAGPGQLQAGGQSRRPSAHDGGFPEAMIRHRSDSIIYHWNKTIFQSRVFLPSFNHSVTDRP